MDKSRVCVNRTINLAKEKKCNKTHLLVYERPKTVPKIPCPPPTHVPRISALPAKKIRVCTGAELKKICPPKLCDCQPKKRFGFIQSLFALLGLGVKTVVAGGLVYLTYDAGIWGDSERTLSLYMNVCEAFVPILCPEDPDKEEQPISQTCEAYQELMCVPPPPPPICCDKMPIDHEKSGNYIKEKWNCMVTCVFEGIAGFPQNVFDLVQSLADKYKERYKTEDPKKKCDDQGGS